MNWCKYNAKEKRKYINKTKKLYFFIEKNYCVIFFNDNIYKINEIKVKNIINKIKYITLGYDINIYANIKNDMYSDLYSSIKNEGFSIKSIDIHNI